MTAERRAGVDRMRSARRGRDITWYSVITGALLVGGCNPPRDPSTEHPAEAAPARAEAAVQNRPESPADHQLAWVLSALNDVPHAPEIAKHFTAAFFDKVSVGQVAHVLAGLNAAAAPFVMERIETERGGSIVAIARGRGGAMLRVSLAVEDGEGARMSALLLQPVDGR